MVYHASAFIVGGGTTKAYTSAHFTFNGFPAFAAGSVYEFSGDWTFDSSTSTSAAIIATEDTRRCDDAGGITHDIIDLNAVSPLELIPLTGMPDFTTDK